MLCSRSPTKTAGKPSPEHQSQGTKGSLSSWVSFKLVIKMFVKMPFDMGLRGWWEGAKHLKGWGLLPSSLSYLQGWVRTWINARESLSDPQLKPRRELEEKIPFSECLYVPGAVLSTLLNRTKIAEVAWYKVWWLNNQALESACFQLWLYHSLPVCPWTSATLVIK